MQSRARRVIVFGILAGVVGLAALAGGAVARPAAGAVGAGARPAQDEGPAAFAYMPFIVRRYERQFIPRPPTLVPPTATATPTNTPEPTVTPTITPTPEDCPPLASRITVKEVTVRPNEVQLSRGGGWDGSRPVLLAVSPGGRHIAVWTDTQGGTWLTPLTPDLERAGKDQWIDADYIRGLVAHDDGATIVARRNADDMYLLRVDNGGRKVWETQIVGQQGQTVVNSKWVDSWGHEGRLVFDGRRYALYMGHTQYFGARGKHQGDLMWYFDADGRKIPNGDVAGQPVWDWGCSHSLDLRLTLNGTNVGGVCLSDEYPAKAMVFNHSTVVHSEPSGNGSGGSDGILGGLVPGRFNDYWFSYSSNVVRKNHDVGLVQIGEDGKRQTELWITDTPAIKETAPHLARHGNKLFVAWRANSEYLGVLARMDGTVEGPPEVLGVEFADRDDFTNLPDGDIAWAAAWDKLDRLKLVRLDFCTRP